MKLLALLGLVLSWVFLPWVLALCITLWAFCIEED